MPSEAKAQVAWLPPRSTAGMLIIRYSSRLREIAQKGQEDAETCFREDAHNPRSVAARSVDIFIGHRVSGYRILPPRHFR
jgi:hypothetical protein